MAALNNLKNCSLKLLNNTTKNVIATQCLSRIPLLSVPCKINVSKRSLFTSNLAIKNNFNVKQNIFNLKQARSMFIDVDATPNVNTLKFKPKGATILPQNQTMEFLSLETASETSPLAEELMEIEGVQSVLFGSDFISITKEYDAEWQMLKPDVYAIIADYIESGDPILSNTDGKVKPVTHTKKDNENSTVNEIKELIEHRIRPSIQLDGGDVEYVDYIDNVVYVKLLGACRSCSMAELTLKQGIENMLKHYIPEIKSVEKV
ncbi:HIRA-interacting protein 5 [Piromyces finnis]|uniref:HIRA-interacting protein 5 n=1 Tax=Piromyces finnis TaxID=1754191 RepID=A0A1Y1V5B1_9FUNG|nr:HIRA-interacting protein 5 [Piromyces finnis]|eukprot:ORX46372.1 HIRA-interacting protein 5 [Piromyces finnis]